jgi:endonuclease/exonuclease/phosphatase family metal-dependent hydrolase
MRTLFLSLGLLALLILISMVVFFLWASYPWELSARVIPGTLERVEPLGSVGNEDFPSVIKVRTWNLSFLYGQGSEGEGYVHRERAFYEQQLDLMAQEIKASGADVICLQEVDFNSHRSGGINQAKYLAQKASYPYLAQAPSWQANYIPFPYWPLSSNFGAMNSGGAILSKYPILEQEVTLLSKPESRPWWYNLFYLHRFIQKVTIELGDKKIKLINVHLEAFDGHNRQQQVEQLVEKIKQEKIDVVAGDFNMLPESASKKSRFSGSLDNYENDQSFKLMSTSGLEEIIPDSLSSLNEEAYFTFPTHRPDRRLDYIFFHPRLKLIKFQIPLSTLSDHLPLEGDFLISDPRFL